MTSTSRYIKVRNTLIFVFTLNIAVALAKGIYGYLTNSVSMLADGFHSLFDGTSNVIGLVGIYIASRPADPSHPYGHTKYETISSMAIGVLLTVTAIQIVISAYNRLFSGAVPEATTTSFIIMLVTITVNFIVSTYESRRGKTLGSELLVSDSSHTRSDIYVSLSVIASLIAVRLGYPNVDVLVAFIIAGVIGLMALSIFKESSDVLCDASMLERDQIHNLVIRTHGVHDCHAIRTRGRRNEIYLDLHVLVDSDLNVNKAHQIANEVEVTVKSSFPEVADVLVHIEPYEVRK